MTLINNRLIRRGDTLRFEDAPEDLVVSKVEVVLFLSNGTTLALDPSDSVELVPREELSEELVQQISELQAANEQSEGVTTE